MFFIEGHQVPRHSTHILTTALSLKERAFFHFSRKQKLLQKKGAESAFSFSLSNARLSSVLQKHRNPNS
jgi:hypothetical protein